MFFSRMFTIALVSMVFFLLSCSEDDNNNTGPSEEEFQSLSSPYLICAGRNPGGVGFDFEYDGKKGGANNMDSLSVSDFNFDIRIRTIKGEKPDGSLGGAPYIQLSPTTQAVNYSAVDTECAGLTDFANLNSSNIINYTLQTDDASFDISSVQIGSTGAPFMQKLMQEYNKLVLGQKWKHAANNDISDDEPIWIIQTNEGRIIKFIVTDFPANPAPTGTGYIAIEWDFVD